MLSQITTQSIQQQSNGGGALLSVSTGVLKPLLSKLTKLLSDKYVKLKWVRRQISFLRDELSTMSATLQMLVDAEDLNPQMRDGT